ncbi:hypothetical protein BO94DRAFT_544983 [Aspergillus sclerotioniger CBS 115572]|uniref:Uncharacterized protein n=1 Tax=Aspergillus sclerotioniger CBS 115572 TaxID=1450535 RepID=A0A317X025_9EURO|nr:hypothetical protein BO94DRAFT_544983 [Aspergillus sclerotioniger CBS 115572]PWY91625.1 hypothetical protein BO94DRAFT_544983 [Aspergillus sclerotioniger CBS 115572]
MTLINRKKEYYKCFDQRNSNRLAVIITFAYLQGFQDKDERGLEGKVIEENNNKNMEYAGKRERSSGQHGRHKRILRHHGGDLDRRSGGVRVNLPERRPEENQWQYELWDGHSHIPKGAFTTSRRKCDRITLEEQYRVNTLFERKEDKMQIIHVAKSSEEGPGGETEWKKKAITESLMWGTKGNQSYLSIYTYVCDAEGRYYSGKIKGAENPRLAEL